MAVGLIKPVIQTLVTVASTSATATSAAFTIPIADSYSFYLNATAATGTLDVVFLTSIDGGTTYVNIPWRFGQNAAATTCLILNVRSGLGNVNDVALVTGNGSATAATGGALALSPCVDVTHMKITYTIGTGPYAFTLGMIAWPRGSAAGID
jgi:hypothetical protein